MTSEPLDLKLRNAHEMSKTYPDTFEYPIDLINVLEPGQFVLVSNTHERFWIEVDKLIGEDKICGTVASDTFDEEYEFGTQVYCQRKHIYDVLGREDTW